MYTDATAAATVMIRNWGCSFIMCSYETVFWLPSFCLVLWHWGRPVNDWNVFLLPLVYLWDCILQHGGSGKKRTSSSWSMQPLRPLNSTDPETIPFEQRMSRRIFPPVNLGQSNLRLFKFLASLGLQTSNLGQGGTASSVVQKESPCTIFFFFFSATLQTFSCKQVCSPYTMRVQAQGEQLHQAHLVIHCTVIYPHVCASDSILLLWPVTTTTYCVPLYRRFAVFLCVPPQNRRSAGFNEWLMNEDAEAE